MADRASHFEIPQSLVRSASIKVRGMAKPFSRPDYSAHGDLLRERTAAMAAQEAEAIDADAAESFFLKVRTPEGLPVRGERQRLRSAGFEIVELSPVDPNSATVQFPKARLEELQSKIQRYRRSSEHVGRSYLAIIEDLAPVPAEEKLSSELIEAPEEPTECLLLLYSTLTDKERAAILFSLRSFIGQVHGTLGEVRRYSNGVTAVEARIKPSDAKLAGAAFTTVRQVVPNHVFFVPDQWRISAFSPQVSVKPPRISTQVAVFDTGISPSCRGLQGCVYQVLPFLPAKAVAPAYGHGTFVGSRIAYGDDLESELRSGTLQPLCPLVDIPVIGVDANNKVVFVHEGHLAAAVDTMIPRLPANARVVNLCLGNMKPAVDGVVSIVAQLLDKHARDRNVVIVTTAGNMLCTPIRRGTLGSVGLLPNGGSSDGNASTESGWSSDLHPAV